MYVQELMNEPPVTCRPDENLSNAAALMWDHDCGAVPVVESDGKIVGMLTDRDICMAAYTQGHPLHAIPVRSVMATQVFSCSPSDSLDQVERTMRDKQIRRMPVVDGGHRVIGVLSLNDIARHCASSPMSDGPNRTLVQTLGAIGEPRAQHGSESKRSSLAQHRAA